MHFSVCFSWQRQQHKKNHNVCKFTSSSRQFLISLQQKFPRHGHHVHKVLHLQHWCRFGQYGHWALGQPLSLDTQKTTFIVLIIVLLTTRKAYAQVIHLCHTVMRSQMAYLVAVVIRGRPLICVESQCTSTLLLTQSPAERRKEHFN